MALTRRQKNKPILRSMARRCIRPSSSLRTAAQAAPVKIQVQESLNHKSPIRRSSLNATDEIGPNSDRFSHHHYARPVALSQRSSLRRALRESLELLDESSRPTGSTSSSALLPRSQRSSLRRAIRDSLTAINTCGGSPVLRANNTESKPAQSLLPGLMPAKKQGFETRHRAINDRNGRVCTRHSSNPKARAVSHAIPQRCSLRLAVRESRYAAVQSIQPVDTTSHKTIPSQALTNPIHDPLSSSDGGSGSVISLSGSSPAIISDTSIRLPEEGILKAQSQMNRASSVLLCTTYRASLTATASRPLAISRPQQGLMPELSLLAESPTCKPLLPTSRSFLDHVQAPKVNDESSRLKSTRHQYSHLASLDRSIRDNERLLGDPSHSQSMPNRKGWHHVREIISEAPGGLFLVEWEERDARTGFKWPASWVKAKDISICAIQDWEKKK
ncbi:hypothetical protein F4782DRAFT_74183 [Xylaria castorea]|nr:hypothetical protein F4782DRAFT_74183 [Xylaria castorea]